MSVATLPITTHGVRGDTDDMFRLAGVLSWAKLNHTPFIAIFGGPDAIMVAVIDSAKKAAALPEETVLLVQWKGEYRSDFFRTTAGEVKRQLALRTP